jgi:hypothetical protein
MLQLQTKTKFIIRAAAPPARYLFSQDRGLRRRTTNDDAAATAAPRILIKSWPVIKFDEKSCECNLSFRVVALLG